ncbi:hypothetical protein [Croceicoccus ponticola]|uniref:hypothetical protein n=1 Tax=Croceicoccus ponticola TaxID=2217664 RepID=UPI0013E3B4A8|nr:hypothetical protein [Croceicoccus ponticola]
MTRFLLSLIPGLVAIGVIAFLRSVNASGEAIMIGALGTFIALYLLLNLSRRS